MNERADRLTAQRGVLLSLLTTADDGSKAAALSREIRAIDAELAEFAVPEVRSRVDDLAKRRQNRLADTPGSDPAPVRKRGGRAGGNRAR